MQVKSSRPSGSTNPTASFTLSRLQLSRPQEIELLYMLMIREGHGWRFFVVPRTRLNDIHRLYVSKQRSGPGRRPKTHEDATTDALTLTLSLTDEPTAWGVSFAEFTLWPPELPELAVGPGAVMG